MKDSMHKPFVLRGQQLLNFERLVRAYKGVIGKKKNVFDMSEPDKSQDGYTSSAAFHIPDEVKEKAQKRLAKNKKKELYRVFGVRSNSIAYLFLFHEAWPVELDGKRFNYAISFGIPARRTNETDIDYIERVKHQIK